MEEQKSAICAVEAPAADTGKIGNQYVIFRLILSDVRLRFCRETGSKKSHATC